MYIQAEQYTDARRMWDSLPVQDSIYAWMADSAINMTGNGRGWQGLDNNGKSRIIATAAYNTQYGYMAMGIAGMTELMDYNWPTTDPVSATGARPANNSNSTPTLANANRKPDIKLSSKNGLWSVYPNPTAGNITVRSSKSGIFVINDLYGREVMNLFVTAGETKIILPKTLVAGVYTGKLMVENVNTEIVRIIYEP